MKQLLYSICAGSIALALCSPGALAKNKNKANKGGSVEHRAAAHGQVRAAVRSHGPRGHQQSVARSRNINRSAQSRAIVNRRAAHPEHGRAVRAFNTTNRQEARARTHTTARRSELANRRELRNRNTVVANGERNTRATRTRELTRSGRVNVTNHWRGDRFSGQRYAAFRNYNRHWHNRSWYRSHYDRIIFVSGGWWYWNTGYWYPAWGYAPNEYYSYDGPIYTGYVSLTPHEIVVNVQVQLRRDGYYAGAVDGLLGPMTRRAIAAFQFDNGLAVTSTIDEPTVSALGVA